MKPLLSLTAAACLALALTTVAGAAPIFGVSDDHGKYAEDGGSWFFSELRAAGLTANKMTVNWDPANPLVITEKAFLDRAIPRAEAAGVHLSFGVHIGKARAITSDPKALAKFTRWLRLVAETYPQVKEYVVGNEPNLTRFWQPQFNANGTGASGVAFARFLAASYDALKEVDPEIVVVGVGLSPRGNDMPNARSNISTSPVKFIRDLGIGYRRLKRDKPIMDVFGFHPYPAKDRDPLARGYRWPNAGVANLDRIKQAIWDAFHGTAQPTFLEGPPPPPEPSDPPPTEPSPPPTEPAPPTPPTPPTTPVEPPLPLPPAVPPLPLPPVPGVTSPPTPPPAPTPEPTPYEEPEPEPEPAPLTFKLDEVGWQVTIPRAARRAYYGRESVRPTDEQTQARIYRELVRTIACDPSVRELLFFGLVDEPNLDRWQAALVRADKSRRPAWAAVRGAVASGCRGGSPVWRHTERVVGASVLRVGRRVRVTAEEDAVVRVGARTYRLRAYRPLSVRASAGAVVLLQAAMNPERTTRLTVR